MSTPEMEQARARFDVVYAGLIQGLLEHRLLQPRAGQMLRPITPQEYMDKICNDQAKRDCINNENNKFLKCIPFPTHDHQTHLMIEPSKLYNIQPQVRSAIFEALKELLWLATFGPELTGIARNVQENEKRQQHAAHAAHMAREQAAAAASQSEGNPNTIEDGSTYFTNFASKLLPPDVLEEFVKNIGEIARDDIANGKYEAPGAEQEGNPMAMLNMITQLVNNPRMTKLFEDTQKSCPPSENPELDSATSNEMLQSLTKDMLKKISPSDSSSAAMAPLLQMMMQQTGSTGGGPADLEEGPGMMAKLMETLQKQQANGRTADLQQTFTMLSRDFTAPEPRPIDDDDLANLSPEEYARMQTMYQEQLQLD